MTTCRMSIRALSPRSQSRRRGTPRRARAVLAGPSDRPPPPEAGFMEGVDRSSADFGGADLGVRGALTAAVECAPVSHFGTRDAAKLQDHDVGTMAAQPENASSLKT